MNKLPDRTKMRREYLRKKVGTVFIWSVGVLALPFFALYYFHSAYWKDGQGYFWWMLGGTLVAEAVTSFGNWLMSGFHSERKDQ